MSRTLPDLQPWLSWCRHGKHEGSNQHRSIEENGHRCANVGAVSEPFHRTEKVDIKQEEAKFREWPDNRSDPIAHESCLQKLRHITSMRLEPLTTKKALLSTSPTVRSHIWVPKCPIVTSSCLLERKDSSSDCINVLRTTIEKYSTAPIFEVYWISRVCFSGSWVYIKTDRGNYTGVYL